MTLRTRCFNLSSSCDSLSSSIIRLPGRQGGSPPSSSSPSFFYPSVPKLSLQRCPIFLPPLPLPMFSKPFFLSSFFASIGRFFFPVKVVERVLQDFSPDAILFPPPHFPPTCGSSMRPHPWLDSYIDSLFPRLASVFLRPRSPASPSAL